MPIVRRKHIRAVVEELLRKHNVRSGPVPVEEMARSFGIRIRREPAPDDLSGFLARDVMRNGTVIGVNRHHHPNRQRFTIGHELGHFLLHEGEQVHVDRNSIGFQVKRRDERSSEGTDIEEQEANLFAAELLIPARLIEHDMLASRNLSLLDENAIKNLAKKYGVSSQALSIRLAYLGYVQI